VTNREYLNRVLNLYSQLDPDLLYFYIEDLHQRFEQTTSEPDSSLRLYHLKYSSKVKFLKQQWAQLNIEKIKQIYTPSLKVTRMKSYFTTYLYKRYKSVMTEPLKNIDKNKQDFYTYIYLANKNDITYDSTLDYNLLRIEIVNELVDYYNKKYEKRTELSEEEITEIIKSAFNHPYLFKDSYLSSYNKTTNFHIYELINYLIKDNYLIHNEIYLQLSFYPLPIIFEEKITFTDPFNDHYKYKYDIEFYESVYLNFGYKYKLKNETTPLSYLNVNVGISIYHRYENSLQDTELFKGTKMMSGYWFTGKYILSNERKSKSFAIATQISVPVYYYNYKLFFEAGLSYSFYSISFEYDFNKEDEIISPGETPPEFYKNEIVNYDEIKHLIYPIIAMNYNVSRNFSIRAEYNIPKYPKISFTYNIKTLK
jgi:hypothetical protein